MVSLDEVFDLFSEERRRLALYYLDEQDGQVSVEELAAAVEEMEAGDPAFETPGAFEDIQITLEHTDLPKAADAEFVHYDREAGVVELTDEPREFELVLSVAEVIEDPTDETSIAAYL
jgi:DNA-binding transcriptional ArsR family regulator